MKYEYAKIEKISKNTYAVIDSANQCLFCSSSELKVKNFLKRLLQNAEI